MRISLHSPTSHGVCSGNEGKPHFSLCSSGETDNSETRLMNRVAGLGQPFRM